jgi:hypothetical protein
LTIQILHQNEGNIIIIRNPEMDDILYELQSNLLKISRLRIKKEINPDFTDECDSEICRLESRNGELNAKIEKYHRDQLEPLKHFLRCRTMRRGRR